jgi:uncharacterized protein (TIGR02271 family)
MRHADRGADVPDERPEVVRHEEELAVGTDDALLGEVRARKRVETVEEARDVPRSVEHVEDELEHVAANEQDSGEIERLPDGSISIPVLEEELVISKRTVVRERIVIRKRTETEQHRVKAELRKERVEIEADEGVEVERNDAA